LAVFAGAGTGAGVAAGALAFRAAAHRFRRAAAMPLSPAGLMTRLGAATVAGAASGDASPSRLRKSAMRASISSNLRWYPTMAAERMSESIVRGSEPSIAPRYPAEVRDGAFASMLLPDGPA
jgi:hypothetical protein